MMEPRLRNKLVPLERLLRRKRVWRELSLTWASAAAAGILLLLVQIAFGWNSRFAWMLPLAAAGIAAGMIWKGHRRRAADFRALVADIERDCPELRHLLSAAAEQEPDPDSGRFGFLQLRVVEAVLAHSGPVRWRWRLEQKLTSAKHAHHLALAGFFLVLVVLGFTSIRGRSIFGSWTASEVTVSPGDTQLERGTGLVISARFGRSPPPEATLVLEPASGKTRRIPLERHLADPVFGISLTEVTEDGRYHIEYGAKATPGYTIRVFDYPALVRADANLRFPEYTGLTNQAIRDTRRISAVEGTRLTYTLQLNKPVAQARLVSGERTLALAAQSNAIALLDDFTLTNSARYALELTDAEGRTNRFATDISIQVLPNRRPELKLTLPRGDPRVSRLEELQLQAEARDDFGLLKYGIGYGVAGREPRFVELGQSAPANEKRRFGYLIPFEQLGVEVDQVVSYFVWADDYGPDGKVRRTFGDMFFAEVRPFEEIFRPEPSGMADNGNQGQQGSPGAELVEIQKEIVIATWKLQQDKAGAATTRSP